MKRFAALLCVCATILSLLSLSACGDQGGVDTPTPTATEPTVAVEPTPAPTGTPEPTPTPTPVNYDPVEPIDFTQFLNEVSAARREEMASKVAFDGFTDYLVDDPAVKDLLTQEEINALKTDHDMPETLTYAQAVSDVDLYFRALKYGYGAYYYFGGDEVFNKAKDQVLAELAGKSTIGAKQLGEILHENMLFVRDGHFNVYGSPPIVQETVRYEYFYCQGQEYAKDENGYYKTASGEKWYYESCSHPSVTMQFTLTDSGKLVYSPVLFCPVTETNGSDTVTLRCGDKVAKETVHWVLQTAYADTPSDAPNIRFLEENNIVYTAIRNSNGRYDDLMTEFEETGLAAKGAELVILDIRSHGGGGDGYARNWIKNFTGHEMELKQVFSVRRSKLDDEYNGAPEFVYSVFDGAFIENDVPVIVLVDDNCGSSGESMLLGAKTINNVLVIGSNSGGYQVCGNRMSFSLPNSGIGFSFGASLQFGNSITNVDGVGHMPDVWCNPETALEAVLNMVKEYDLVDAADEIYEAWDEVLFNCKNITLRWAHFTLEHESEEVGVSLGGHSTAFVKVNGVLTDDFTVESSDPNVLACTKKGSGIIELHFKNPGRCKVLVTCGKTTAVFRWRVNG